MSSSTITPVTADLFAEELEEEPKWYDLGVFLGITTNELDSIQARYMFEGQRRCLIEIYKCLEKRTNPIQWKAIINALERMKNNKLAGYLKRKYVKGSASAIGQPSSMSSENENALEPINHGSRENKDIGLTNLESEDTSIVVSKEVTKAFREISDKFATLVLQLRQALRTEEVTIDDIQAVILEHYELEPLEGSDATLEKIFSRLHRHYCVLHYHILKYLAHTFLKNHHELHQTIIEYDADVEKFKESTTLKALMYTITENQNATEESQIVKLKVREFWRSVTLKKFEKFASDILETLYEYVSQIRVEKGCVCISWVIPKGKASKPIMPQSLEFIRVIGVVSLHIGENVIYDMPSEGCEVMEAAMLQAIELKNTRAVELLLEVGCNPEVITFKMNISVKITVELNVEEEPIDDHTARYVCVFEDHSEETTVKEKMQVNLLRENDMLRKELEAERTKYQEEIKPMKADLDLQRTKVHDSEKDVSSLKSHQMKKETEFQLLQLRSDEQNIEIDTLARKLKQKEDEAEKLADQSAKLHLQLLGHYSSPVTLKDFVSELEVLHEQDWYALGMMLGLPETKLKEIGSNYQLEGLGACLRELFKSLLILGRVISWENVARALLSTALNNQELAHSIYQKYCHGRTLPYTVQQVAKEDNSLVRYLTKACCHGLDEPRLTFDEDGFFSVSEILRHKRGKPAFEDDIRRVVASSTLFTLREGPPLSIRANRGHSIKKISQKLQIERELHQFLFDACNYGVFGKELYCNKDGYVKVEDLLSLRKEYTEKDVRKSVEYSFSDKLVLKEGPPLMIKLAFRQYQEGPYTNLRTDEIFGKLKKICRKGSKEKEITFDQEGYAPVAELLPLLSYCEATEDDVRKMVDNSKKNLFTLKEGPPLQIKANWGHKLKEVTTYNLPTVKSHCEVPLVLHFIKRREWVNVKREGLRARGKNKIEFSYETVDTIDEKELLKRYGSSYFIIVLDMEKALKHGLQFLKVPPEKLICLQDPVSPEYFKRVI